MPERPTRWSACRYQRAAVPGDRLTKGRNLGETAAAVRGPAASRVIFRAAPGIRHVAIAGISRLERREFQDGFSAAVAMGAHQRGRDWLLGHWRPQEIERLISARFDEGPEMERFAYAVTMMPNLLFERKGWGVLRRGTVIQI